MGLPGWTDGGCRGCPRHGCVAETRRCAGRSAAIRKPGLRTDGEIVVGRGANQPISPDQVHQALGPELIQQLAAKTGLSVPELTQKLAQILPQAVDRMTPDGVVPKA